MLGVMFHSRVLFALLITLFLSTTALAANYSGTWEIRSLGADRQVTVTHTGNKIMVHRVLWPVFEGEKYKLEHLYRGTAKKNHIRGKLLVKEEGQKAFEVLRDFDGRMESNGTLTIDGLPLQRVVASKQPRAAHEEAPPAKPAEQTALPSSPHIDMPGDKAPNAPSTTAEASNSADVDLYTSLMGFPGSQSEALHASSQIKIPNAAEELTLAGDALFKKHQHAAALTKYNEAVKVGGTSAHLQYRIGLCYKAYGNYVEARKYLRRALRLDPYNRQLNVDYKTVAKLDKSTSG
ncbi:MAG: tetratricopeptide repeat protein [Myxococcota bacterium]